MATDSTGCSGEVCRGSGTRWAGGAERVSRWLRVCICGRSSRREIFSPHPLSKETSSWESARSLGQTVTLFFRMQLGDKCFFKEISVDAKPCTNAHELWERMGKP